MAATSDLMLEQPREELRSGLLTRGGQAFFSARKPDQNDGTSHIIAHGTVKELSKTISQGNDPVTVPRKTDLPPQ